MTAQERAKETRAQILEAQLELERLKTSILGALAEVASRPDAATADVLEAARLAVELRK